NFGGLVHFHRAVKLVEAEPDERSPLGLVATDWRSGLGDLDLRHHAYSVTVSAWASASAALAPPRPSRSETFLPRRWATERGLVCSFNASKVARIMLYGFDVPTDLVTTSATPRLSKIARIGPPEMIPVPAGAVRIVTRPAPKWPRPSWWSVRPSRSGTRIIAFFADAVALLIASGTSRALPWLKPARPLPSPTTTSAAKPKRLPPFTVFETRLMWTSFSISSSPPSSSSRRPRRSSRRPRPRPPPSRPRPPRPRGPRCGRCSSWAGASTAGASVGSATASLVCWFSSCILELQSAFAGSVGEGLHPAMEQEAAAVEHDARYAGFLRALGERLADRGRALARSPGLALQILVQARSRGDRLAGQVIDDLSIDVTSGAVNRQPRLAGGAGAKRAAHAAAASIEKREFRHGLLLLAFFAEDVLAAVLDTLALVRLGLAPAADLGRDLADLLLVDAADLDRVLVRSLHIDAFGQLVIDVVAVAELQAQVLALGLGVVADAGDLEHLGEALGHACDEVLDHRPLHAPGGARLLRRADRRNQNLVVLDRIDHVVEHRHGQGPFRALDHQQPVFVGRSDAARDGDGFLSDTGHQNTSASTSPPTFCSRASASDNTPRGVDTMIVPSPLRMRGSSRAAE